MAGYSLDLRERIISAVERGDQTNRAVALRFEVHESFIYKLLRQQRAVGHLAPLPHGGGHTAKLQAEQLAVLAALVAQTPDATLAELATQVQRQTGVQVSDTTVWRGLQTLDLTRKKRAKSPPKRIR